MPSRRSVLLAAFLAAAAMSGCAAAAAVPGVRFANPLQPWASPDGQVHLLRPLFARAEPGDGAVGALTSGGWRLVWDGSPPAPGRVVVRLAMPVAPRAPQTRTTEYLQVGVSRAREAVSTCLASGLRGPSAVRRPDRVINGRRFAVWENGDAGMSQQIAATDLRTVADGTCWAVERFSYGDTATPTGPAPGPPAAEGAALMDRALASLQLGPLRPGEALAPPRLPLPPGAAAR